MPIFKNWYDDQPGINPATGMPKQPVSIKGPDTTVHAVLTVLTCGLWLPIWIIAAITGKKRIEYR